MTVRNDFLAQDVSRIIGLKTKDVIDACQRGIIEPRLQARGTGTRRIFSFKNVIQFQIFKILRGWGFSRPSIKRIFETIESGGEADKLYSMEESKETIFLAMVESEDKRLLRLISVKAGQFIKFDPEDTFAAFLINISETKKLIVERVEEI